RGVVAGLAGRRSAIAHACGMNHTVDPAETAANLVERDLHLPGIGYICRKRQKLPTGGFDFEKPSHPTTVRGRSGGCRNGPPLGTRRQRAPAAHGPPGAPPRREEKRKIEAGVAAAPVPQRQ